MVSVANGYAIRMDCLQLQPQRPRRRLGRTFEWWVTCDRRTRHGGAVVVMEAMVVTCFVDFVVRQSDACGDGGDDDPFPANSVRSTSHDWRCRNVCYWDCDPWNDDGGDDRCHGDVTMNEVAGTLVVGCLWVLPMTRWANRRIAEYAPYELARGSTKALRTQHK